MLKIKTRTCENCDIEKQCMNCMQAEIEQIRLGLIKEKLEVRELHIKHKSIIGRRIAEKAIFKLLKGKK